ncbi:putative (Fe) hydrogenase, HymB subunit [Candidatus Zixiibacteriota bacterium]|nr:putative (Fe) hydrogenase, HymB subunit [candidate division Zixibacteria bacterium]
MRVENIDKLSQWREECRRDFVAQERKVLICFGTACEANGAPEVYDEFKKIVAQKKIPQVSIETFRQTGCHGYCAIGPLVIIEPQDIFYTKVKVKDVAEIVEKTLEKNEVIDRLLYSDIKTHEHIARYREIPFYAHQQRIALRNCGLIDPLRITDAIATGGYAGLAKALTTMTPQQVIAEISKSALRGRGGGGFLTGKKWATCAGVPSDIRYVICNGDEGDPGAFMDRTVMGSDPHSVLEGMIICAYAVGSTQGYIYVREEYPQAVYNLKKAIEQAREAGLLGENILGTGLNFDIQVNRGGGAFVCGESSALMKSVAGEVGEPRAKYIHSVIKGLYDKPTVLNNVETFVTVSMIIEKGADWFTSIGTKKSPGTKVFSLAGKVNNTGLVEVPMGMTLRQIIFDIGGGIPNERKFKAVQTGGPSGGCLPDAKLDLPVDFDSLTEAGSMMGSGGMIIMDDRTCMVDVARYFLAFLVYESCGKCVPCREGLYQLHRLCEKITEGKGEDGDLEQMEKLSRNIQIGSLCGLGQSGPNPFLSTIQYFRDEYEAHIRDKKCPAGVCRALIKYEITDDCTGCLACIKACPVGAITGERKKKHFINQLVCDRCGSCYATCNFDAIEIK